MHLVIGDLSHASMPLMLYTVHACMILLVFTAHSTGIYIPGQSYSMCISCTTHTQVSDDTGNDIVILPIVLHSTSSLQHVTSCVTLMSACLN
jgi:hypothetical protein